MSQEPLFQPPDYYIEMDEASHVYFVDGEPKLSVTQILKAAGFIDTQFFTEFGRWRGSETHKATHYYDEGDLDERTIDQKIKPFLRGYKNFRAETKFTPTLIEVPLYSDRFDFCGRPDRRGFFAGDGSDDEANEIIDLKCYPGGQPPWWTRFQLAGYGYLLDPHRLFRRFAVVLTGEGERGYNVKEYSRDSYVQDVDRFLACVAVAHMQREFMGGLRQ
jgi:hypothetical protein